MNSPQRNYYDSLGIVNFEIRPIKPCVDSPGESGWYDVPSSGGKGPALMERELVYDYSMTEKK